MAFPMAYTPTTYELAIEELRAQVHGTVHEIGELGYDEAVNGFDTLANQRPALTLVAESASDVVAGVRFAREQGLKIAVQGTGHGTMRRADNDSLLIVTSRMNAVRINPGARTAWVEAGVKWGAVLARAQAYGLAPLLGSSPDVGVVGYTLGGGMGWLARKHGLSADNVRFVDVVTPDGQFRRASATENADLFWAIRGGGANFGVVTAIEVDLFPVTTVYAGNLFFPAHLAREAFARYRDWVKMLPDAFTSSISVMNFPPIPQVPEFLRGQSMVIMRGCYVGPVEEGAKFVDEWRQWQPPVADMFGPMPFANAAAISNDPTEPMGAYTSAELLNWLSDEAIETILRYGLKENGSPLTFIELRHGGGAISRVSADVNAIGNRQTQFFVHIIAAAPTPDALAGAEYYGSVFKRALEPHTNGGMYLNFMGAGEVPERTRNGYTPQAYRRLQAIKAKYDPENLFSYGFSLKED